MPNGKRSSASSPPARWRRCASIAAGANWRLAALASRSSSPQKSRARLLKAPQELERAPLRQRLVEIAALRRLHARGAARLALTLADQTVRVPNQALEFVVAAFGDPDATGVTVVDEDRR